MAQVNRPSPSTVHQFAVPKSSLAISAYSNVIPSHFVESAAKGKEKRRSTRAGLASCRRTSQLPPGRYCTLPADEWIRPPPSLDMLFRRFQTTTRVRSPGNPGTKKGTGITIITAPTIPHGSVSSLVPGPCKQQALVNNPHENHQKKNG